MTDPVAAGYAASTDRIAADKAEKVTASLAAGFTPDDRMERLIALRSEDRAEFNSIVNGMTRMTLANYERAKSAAASR